MGTPRGVVPNMSAAPAAADVRGVPLTEPSACSRAGGEAGVWDGITGELTYVGAAGSTESSSFKQWRHISLKLSKKGMFRVLID